MPPVSRLLEAAGGDAAWGQTVDTALTHSVGLPGGVSWTDQAGAVTWSFSNLAGHGLMTRSGGTNSALLLWDPFGQPVDPVSFAIKIRAEASRAAFWDNKQGRQWDQLIAGIAKNSKSGITGTICAAACLEIGNDHWGVGFGPKATLDGSVSTGVTFNGPTTRTSQITGNCSAALGVGGYVEASAHGTDPSGVNTAFSSGFGAVGGVGAGCAVMFNFYW